MIVTALKTESDIRSTIGKYVSMRVFDTSQLEVMCDAIRCDATFSICLLCIRVTSI